MARYIDSLCERAGTQLHQENWSRTFAEPRASPLASATNYNMERPPTIEEDDAPRESMVKAKKQE